MSLKEKVVKTIDHMPESELQKVADYLAFLAFRQRSRISVPNEKSLEALYQEFAEEDRLLAEAGIGDYARGIAAEETR